MKRSKMLAKKNGFDKATSVDIAKIGVKNHHEMRILRWDQAMLRWPNYNQEAIKSWGAENYHVLKKMCHMYYGKYLTVFRAHGWEPEDLYNVLLWHAFVYLNTPHIQYKNNEKYVWSHIKQRFVETIQVLQKRSEQDISIKYVSADNKLELREETGSYGQIVRRQLLSAIEKNRDFFDNVFVKNVIKKLSKIENTDEQKKMLQDMFNRARIKKNKNMIKTLIEIYEHV